MSNIDSTATIKVDVYQKVTDAIVNAIEQGVGNWRMPWHTSGRHAFSPINTTSRKADSPLAVVLPFQVTSKLLRIVTERIVRPGVPVVNVCVIHVGAPFR
jgi:antirestriction protein ArdC